MSIYGKNNFLTTHDDGSLGHFAFVLYLSKNWNESNGGILHFSCHHKKGSCYSISHIFNRLVLFQVHPTFVPHYVTEVIVDKPRIALTGWYFSNDIKSGVNWDSITMETGYGNK